MRYPLTEVAPGIFRPIVPAFIWREGRQVFVDGLLDMASDRTLLSPFWAFKLGIDIGTLTTAVVVKSATGQKVICKPTRLLFELRRDGERCCWLADVVITGPEVVMPHWGFKGFLDYFHTSLDGPNRMLTVTASDRLPAVPPP